METNNEKIIKKPAKEASKEDNSQVEEKIEQKIYIGPNMLQLITYTVIEGDYPIHIKDLVEKCPEIERLFVPISELVNAESRTKTKGTLEYRNYLIVSEFNQGGE